MRIAQISDCHLHAAEGELHYGVDPDAGLRRVLDDVAAWAPDLIVATGDLAEVPAAYARLRRRFTDVRIPVLAIPGNHDDADAMRKAMSSALIRIGGQILQDGWRIMTLDTTVPGQAHGRLADDQLRELDQALTDDTTPTLIFIHHHPVPVGSPWIDGQGLRNPEALFQRLANTRCVKGLAYGHIHHVFETQLGELKLMSAPATSTQAKPRRERFVEDDVGPGFRWFELGANGTLTTGVIRATLSTSATPDRTAMA